MRLENDEEPVSERLTKIENRLASIERIVSELRNRLAWVERIVNGLEGRLARVESDVAWLKHLYKSLDNRVWIILGGIIITILLNLMR